MGTHCHSRSPESKSPLLKYIELRPQPGPGQHMTLVRLQWWSWGLAVVRHFHGSLWAAPCLAYGGISSHESTMLCPLAHLSPWNSLPSSSCVRSPGPVLPATERKHQVSPLGVSSQPGEDEKNPDEDGVWAVGVEGGGSPRCRGAPCGGGMQPPRPRPQESLLQWVQAGPGNPHLTAPQLGHPDPGVPRLN